MEKFIALLLAVAMLAGAACCSNLLSGVNTSESGNETSLIWNGKNNNPISAVYGLDAKDIESVYFSGSRFKEGRFPLERQEQYLALISNLRKLELLEKVENFDKDSAKDCLSYEIQVKNADLITLNFYDNVVDFGQGYYFYADANNSAFPEKTTAITIDMPGFDMSIRYDNPEDIKGLQSELTASKNDGAPVHGNGDFAGSMSIGLSDGLNENISLCVKEENNKYFLFKNFFTAYFFMGEISRESYDSLILACKNQYGTHEHFSVTSGNKTIYPLGHFMYARTFDEHTGHELVADGFPQLSEWADKLESITYEPNFEVSAKNNQATLRLSTSETYVNITLSDIKALPPGEYTIACILTTQGTYVEKIKDYNSYTDIYWFTLVKP